MSINTKVREFIKLNMFDEEGVTSYICHELTKKGNIIWKPTRHQERENGTDYVINNKIAVQAKRVVKGRYKYKYKDQYEKFLKYVKENNLIGLYAFYSEKGIEVVKVPNFEKKFQFRTFNKIINESKITNSTSVGRKTA